MAPMLGALGALVYCELGLLTLLKPQIVAFMPSAMSKTLFHQRALRLLDASLKDQQPGPTVA